MKTKSGLLLKSIHSNIDPSLVLIEIVQNQDQRFAVRPLGMPEQLFDTYKEAERHAQSALMSFYLVQ